MKVVRPSRLGVALIAFTLLSMTVLRTDASASTASPSIAEYDNSMEHTPTPAPGCFDSTYPSTTWTQVTCGLSHGNVTNDVGDGTDYSAVTGTSYIGFAQGQFSSAANITSEYDTGQAGECNSPTDCPNYYSLQLNTQLFDCTPQNMTAEGQCWEQFIFENVPLAGDASYIFIEYWIYGLGSTCYSCDYGCPSSNWTATNGDCLLDGPKDYTPVENLTNSVLDDLTLTGQSNLSDSGEDEVALCIGVHCYTESNPAAYFDLYNYWNYAEFNAFGYEDRSGAIFDATAAWTTDLQVEDSTGGAIDPTCNGPTNGGQTAEYNSLTLVSNSCNPGSYPYYIMNFEQHD